MRSLEDLEEPSEPPPFERLSPLDVSKGPLKRRHPTDVCCLFLFGGFWVVLSWLVLSSLSGSSSPVRLTAGIDWMGRACGLDKGVEHLPYLYWPSKAPPKAPVDTEMDSCNLIPVGLSPAPPAFGKSASHLTHAETIRFFDSVHSFVGFMHRSVQESALVALLRLGLPVSATQIQREGDFAHGILQGLRG